MDEIFSSTTHCIIYLGEDNGSVKSTREALQNISHDAYLEVRDLASLAGILYDGAGFWQHSSSNMSVDVDLSSVLTLFSSPWFRRLWVAQEAVLPSQSTVYVGDTELSPSHILTAACWLAYKERHLPFDLNDCPGILTAIAIWEFSEIRKGTFGFGTGWDTSFLNLLVQFRRFDCSDARDHVYGFLGLYKSFLRQQELPAALRPDYEKTLEQVFQAATKYTINSRGDLEMFRRLHRRPTEDKSITRKLPSWVPRWHRQWGELQDAVQLGPHFDAAMSKSLEMVVLDTESDHVLSIKGIIVDDVQRVSTIMTSECMPSAKYVTDSINRYKLLGDSIPSFSLPEATTALAITLCAGVDHVKKHLVQDAATRGMDSYHSYLSRESKLCPTLQELGQTRAELTSDELVAAQFQQSMRVACQNRRFFVTSRGRIGVGPQSMQSGDLVAVLCGCPWPVILRPQHRVDYYELLEPAYVNGIMFGKAVGKHNKSGKGGNVFHLV